MPGLEIIWNNKQNFTVRHDTFPPRTYQIVDKIPVGYFIWNIGAASMPEGYIPLCQWANPAKWRHPDEYKINENALLAVKTRKNRVRDIMNIVAYGPSTPSELEEFIDRRKTARRGTIQYRHRKLAEKALVYMNQLPWQYHA